MGFDLAVAGDFAFQRENTFGGRPVKDESGVFTFKARKGVYNKDTKETKYVTEYIDVRVYGEKLCQRIRAFPEGKVVFIRGTIDDLRAYTDKEGNARASLSIKADNISYPPKDFSEENAAEARESSGSEPDVDEADDPFDAPPPPPARSTKVNI